MADMMEWMFGGGLSPLGTLFAGRTDLSVLHATSDILIFVTCLSISLALLRFMRAGRYFQFPWFFGLFSIFMLFMGLVHLLGALTIWMPWHGLHAVTMLLTAGIALVTAIIIWPLIPRVMALPSPSQYASANRRLQKAMDALARSNAELESRVVSRTAELEAATQQLQLRREEAEAAAEERSVMLREMHHRTGNNLQIISSFVGLTLRGVKDPAAANAIREIRARLAAITDVNRLLLRSDTFGSGRADEYLQRLTDDLKETLLPPDSPIRITADLAPVSLPADSLTYLGLVAVELITNSVKYAFPHGAGGEVAVRLVRTGEGVVFVVADDGVGYDVAAAAQGPGAGATIVRQFASRLNADVEHDSRLEEGTRVRLLFRDDLDEAPDA